MFQEKAPGSAVSPEQKGSVMACYNTGNVSSYASGTYSAGGIIGGGTYGTSIANYYSASESNDNLKGIGNKGSDTEGSTTKVDGSTTLWTGTNSAMEKMNAKLTDSDYKYYQNGKELNELWPLILRKGTV